MDKIDLAQFEGSAVKAKNLADACNASNWAAGMSNDTPEDIARFDEADSRYKTALSADGADVAFAFMSLLAYARALESERDAMAEELGGARTAIDGLKASDEGYQSSVALANERAETFRKERDALKAQVERLAGALDGFLPNVETLLSHPLPGVHPAGVELTRRGLTEACAALAEVKP